MGRRDRQRRALRTVPKREAQREEWLMRQRFVRLWLVLSLAALGALTLAAPVAAGSDISVTLSGPAERPDPGDPGATGTFTADINVGQRTLCYTLTVELTVTGTEAPFAAHIHIAPVTSAGPVVIPLATPTATGEPGVYQSSGCVEGLDKELLKAILKFPELFYVNVHNLEFPGGAARAQLG
jgi:hypothetical protein